MNKREDAPVSIKKFLPIVKKKLPIIARRERSTNRNTRDIRMRGARMQIIEDVSIIERLHNELGIPRPALNSLLKQFGFNMQSTLKFVFDQNRSGFIAFQAEKGIKDIKKASAIISYTRSTHGQMALRLSGSNDNHRVRARYVHDEQGDFKLDSFESNSHKKAFQTKIPQWFGTAVLVPTRISMKSPRSM